MKFDYPHLPAQFEIPDTWWQEAGMDGFQIAGASYLAADAAAPVVALSQIAPPFRFAHVPKDFRGFDRQRMIQVLTGFVQEKALPSVDVISIPEYDAFYKPFPYGLLDGVHRFFASIAAGFVEIPVAVRAPFL